jgi:hypothetical protein
MVTAAEMSSIVGTAVTAGSEDGSISTCRYRPAERSTPSVEITVDRGGGRAAMTAAGILSRREPGIADPLAGLGDEASAIGPAFWVRVGDDLVNLTLWGVDEDVAVAKRIVSTMRPRMGPSSQPNVADAHGDGDTSVAIPKEAQERIGSLLGRLGQPESAAAPSAKTVTTAPRLDEPAFRSAAGLPRRKIPLVLHPRRSRQRIDAPRRGRTQQHANDTHRVSSGVRSGRSRRAVEEGWPRRRLRYLLRLREELASSRIGARAG